ncbi:nose resistant to fluoxetine protein 6-like [Sycon ciliatum]|uniref:nose resistant to fluoxetine protein 6-like n=1 Tax=Sycon ciliatum TaxID=27933 RepID=UPI0031F6FC94
MAGQYQYMYQLCVILVSALALVHARADTQADDSEGTTTIRRGPYVPALVLQNTPVDNTLSEACLAAFHNLTDDPATKFQVMKMLDAFGKPGAGAFEGDFSWYGDYQECQSIPIAKYCVSSFTFNLSASFPPMQTVIGLCLPKECTEEDAALLPSHINELSSNPFSMSGNATNMIAKFMAQHEIANTSTGFCLEPLQSNAGFAGTLFLIFSFVALLVIGTLVDSFYCADQQLPRVGVVSVDRSSHSRPPANGYVTTGHDVQYSGNMTDEKLPLLGAVSGHTAAGQHAGGAGKSSATSRLLIDLLLCFSVPRKLKTILAAEHKQGTIPCLHGLRFFSMCWVILGHCYMWPTLIGESNILYAYSIMKRTSFQWVLNGTFSVDTFFFLSGLLVTFLTLKHMESTGGQMKWPMFYIHRFLRLTPLYMFVILMVIYVTPYIGQGPIWPHLMQGMGDTCKKYWWTNLLYINNFYPTGLASECIGWSWYLANDMQFFIISPIVIVAAYRFHKAGVAVTCGFLIVSCIIIRAALTYSFNDHLSVFTFGVNTDQMPVAVRPTRNMGDVLYTKPYTRVATYAIGMVVGYTIRRMPNSVHTLPRSSRLVIATLAWMLAAILLLAPVFGLTHMYKHSTILSMSASIMYNGFGRVSWGLGLAILVLACHSGYGGFVNGILSHPMWIPLSRLTYGAYLVHPVILFLMFSGVGQAVYFTDTIMIFYYLAALTSSYILSLVFAVLLEYPLLAVESRLVGR